MTDPNRRRFLIASSALATSCRSFAQPAYPSRQARIVVGFAPGGAADVFARLLAVKASAALGQTVIVDNRPGAGAIIAADYVAKSAADGHTLFLTFSEALVSNTALYRNLPYNPSRDFTFVAMLSASQLVIAVNRRLPATNLAEFVAYARALPATAPLNFGSWGAGSHGHLLCEALNKHFKLRLQHVPYKGEGPTIQDLVGGQIQIAAGSIGGMAPHIRSGALKALGVIGDKPSVALPQIKSLAEQGLSDAAFTTLGWMGLVAPSGTPGFIVDRWAEIVREFVGNAETLQRLQNYGFEPRYLAKAAFFRAWQTDMPVWTRLIQDAGVTLD
jgi:tripartite-type tricarboxylate transporter receptor subunit TctC